MSEDTQEKHPATQIVTASRSDALGGTEIELSGELATAALMAQARAAVEARFKVALARPRNPNQVRIRLLAECKRPKFADEAIYAVPRGKVQDKNGEWVENIVEGPSIRFVEAALRIMGNNATRVVTSYEDERKVIVNVSVTDLETNTTYDTDLTITKTTERRSLRKNQSALGSRTNSYGERVYIVEATDQDVDAKQAARVSKAIRTQGLRIIDGDLVAEAMDMCNAILANQAAKDPAAERKAVADAFASLSIMPTDIEHYLGCRLDQVTPAHMARLRNLYTALRDGVTTWADIIEGRGPKPAPAAAPPQDAAPAKAPPAETKPAPTPAPEADPKPPVEPRRRTQAEIDADGANGVIHDDPPPEVVDPATATAVQLGAHEGKPVKDASPAAAPFDKAIENARARDEERKAKDPAAPKRGTAAAKAAVAKAKPQAATGGLFDAAAPPPGDEDLPQWAGGRGGPSEDPPVDPTTGTKQAF